MWQDVRKPSGHMYAYQTIGRRQVSSVSMTTTIRVGLRRTVISILCNKTVSFLERPDRLWAQLKLLAHDYEGFPRGKADGV